MKFDRSSFLCLLAGAALASGCSSLGVKPWQRDVMAREEMRLDANPLTTLQSTTTCISARRPPREAAPMRAEAAGCN